MEESIKNLAETFFDKLNIRIDSCEIKAEAPDIYLVEIKTEESGLIIGPHWKNLETIKFLLKLLASKKLEKNIILHLEVNDYLKIKQQKLFSFIKTKIDLVESNWKEIELPFLTAYERKKVHSYVWEQNTNVCTKSEWEWKNRRMFLYKKPEKLCIDIEGDDI